MSDDAPLPALPHDQPLPARTDLWTAGAFLLIGLTILVLSLQMPTYEEQQGEIYTAPGLVPSLYGVVISLLSVWLGYRSIRRGALSAGQPPSTRREGYSNARLALAAVLGLLFTIGFIGRMPFWVGAAIFVTLFIALFEWEPGLPWRIRARRLATALLQGAVTGALVTLVFEEIFLVRLP